MDGEEYGHTAEAIAHPGLTALERGVALARVTRATLEQRLRQAEARRDTTGVDRLRRALLIADRRAKRLGGVLNRERRRLAERLHPGRPPP
jgi:hypothetical protein